MKTFLYTVIALSLTLASPADAQAPIAPAPAGAKPTTAQTLRAIRDQNARMLEQQAKTIQQLNEMEAAAQSLKILGKRS